MDYAIRRKMELLRTIMVELATERGSLLDKDVIWVSQELDKLLVLAQRNYRNHYQVLKKAQ